MHCQKCEEINKDNAAFCNMCGADLRPVSAPAGIPDNNYKYNIVIETQIKMLESQKKGHVGPLILVILGILLFFLGRAPGFYGLPFDFNFSGIGKIFMTVAVIWDLWRIRTAGKLDKQIETLRATLE